MGRLSHLANVRLTGSRYADLIPRQQIAVISSFTLHSGVVLRNVPVAYTTYGQLNAQGTNVLVVCHALSGSADVADWWGPLMGGPGRVLDASRFFIVCLNSLGSPYGTASPVTFVDGDPDRGRYGPDFPLTTIRDDVGLHKLVLDDLGVRQIAAVIGGSMGGMLTLEYAFLGPEYVRSIVPIATASRHSAWGISWGEAQRQSIYCDPKYDDGYYTFGDPPAAGLGAARMQALLTYRSRDSFEARFGRTEPIKRTSSENHFAIHNEGHRSAGSPRPSTASTDPQFHGPTTTDTLPGNFFSAQSYLRYQGTKFVRRFDANCYIAITRKLDTHDVSRDRVSAEDPTPVATALNRIMQPALVIGIESDGLFTFAEQQEIAANILNAELRTIDSPEGHDAFLLQFEQVNQHILEFLHRVLPDMMTAQANAQPVPASTQTQVDDITEW